MRTILVVFSFFWLSFFGTAQVLEFDMLEMKYSQGHYGTVYRKANRLMDNPEYDFSYLPRYYRILSGLQLAQNPRWLKRNSWIFSEASELFEKMNSTFEGRSVLRAHMYEMSALKNDLKQWAGDLKVIGDRKTFGQVELLLDRYFKDVKYILELPEDKTIAEKYKEVKEVVSISAQREQILNQAKKHIGVPYKWAGTSPNGFDCSGFTSYVFQVELDKRLARRAADQYQEVKKVRKKHVQPGDFVFFDNGQGISHVGIVTRIDQHSLQMIHASTSIGISIVDINTSSYWKGRLVGFGTYFDQ